MTEPTHAEPAVLVLDDEQSVLTSIRRSLIDQDYRLRLCLSPDEARRILAEDNVAVALVDYRLSGAQDGLTFLRELAGTRPDCFRILFTGVADFDFVVGAINEGHIEAFLPKPWSDEYLLALVHQGRQTFDLRRGNSRLREELLERNRELEKFNQNLEIQVADRTRSLREANQQMRQYQEEMVRLETQANLSRLVRGLAHELNNPLSVILGQTEFMQRILPDEPRLAKKLDSIHAEVERCAKLVERLCTYYTPLEETLQDIRISDAIAYAIDQFAQRGVEPPAVDYEHDMPPVIALTAPLGQVFEQIIDNALLAGARHVWFRCKIDRDRVRLYIENDGETPDAETISNAVKPFFTTCGGDHAGLGLALASSFMREFGGVIMLDARHPGPGASVSLTLSLAGTSSIRKAIETTRIKRRQQEE